MTKQVLYGQDAIDHVAHMENRPLSIPEMMVIEEEGFVNQPYKDTKGITTYGVGQTGEWINKSFGEAFDYHEEEARRYIPTYDELPEEVQGALMLAVYRGDLQQSPKFRKLFNAGEYAEAAAEFLDNQDYRESLEEGTGVAQRMERVASLVHDLDTQGEEWVEAEELTGKKKADDPWYVDAWSSIKELLS